MTKPTLSTEDVETYRGTATQLGQIFGTCFESQEKYEEAYAANGGTPQVIEAMNKIWKSLLLQHNSNGGGHTSEAIGLQTPRRVLRMSDPSIREFSKGIFEQELKRTYICGWCNGEKTNGHTTKVCPKNPNRQVLTSAEALRILEENRV
ncbi:hypothetical protein CYMTET_37880 [Cymbomonas tetramitiformis]|uniref:Uncharacterized protein n=1 Tax=Cymbomonas tetramitiformis TaxID=36881 RepID=A0AAE0CEU7_9CHLO|nr:hypothetical protein CYMTET_37880 [Cymbomonas tetramitiformis]